MSNNKMMEKKKQNDLINVLFRYYFEEEQDLSKGEQTDFYVRNQ
jgi:hypothetical protein